MCFNNLMPAPNCNSTNNVFELSDRLEAMIIKEFPKMKKNLKSLKYIRIESYYKSGDGGCFNKEGLFFLGKKKGGFTHKVTYLVYDEMNIYSGTKKLEFVFNKIIKVK